MAHPIAVGDFLRWYTHDALVRWSAEDLAAQQRFVNEQMAGMHWLDWSSASAALQLWQAEHLAMSVAAPAECEALLLAGPIVEMVALEPLLRHASAFLKPHGRLVGIIPCLRDNSPESQLFSEIAASMLWPYLTAEELIEICRELGCEPNSALTHFIRIPQFNEMVLKDKLAFNGFAEVFRELERQGYNPMEVGWGELRLAASFLCEQF